VLSAVEIFFAEGANGAGSGAAGIFPLVDRPRRRP